MKLTKRAENKARAIAAFEVADKARRASIDTLTPGDQLWADRGSTPWVVEKITPAGALCASKASKRWFDAGEVASMYRRLEDTPMVRWFDHGERSTQWPRNKGHKHKAETTPVDAPAALGSCEGLFCQLVRGSVMVDGAGREYMVVMRHDKGARYVSTVCDGVERPVSFFELANMRLKGAK